MAEKTKLHLPLMLRLKFWVGSFFIWICTRTDGSINRRIWNLIDQRIAANSTIIVENIPVTSSDISIDPSRDLWFRLFVPKISEKLPFVVYFHGGGFAFYGSDSEPFDHFCRTLSVKIPAIVASVNYRLAPEHKYPCQYEDGFDAFKFIMDAINHAILPPNADLKNCYLVGDSAGGNIAHHVALRASKNSQLFDNITIAGLVAVQPFFGGEERTESELSLTKAPVVTANRADKLWRMFLPVGADRNHPAANVFGDNKVIECINGIEFPRTLVIVGGYDPLQDWQKRYAEGLIKCGKEVKLVEYGDAFHGFYGFQEFPEFKLLVEDVRKFIHYQ